MKTGVLELLTTPSLEMRTVKTDARDHSVKTAE